jgi:hypothetical protein
MQSIDQIEFETPTLGRYAGHRFWCSSLNIWLGTGVDPAIMRHASMSNYVI